MLTMFGAWDHYNGIGLGPGRPGRPVGTAIGGAGRSFGIHRAIPQHVYLGCVMSPQAAFGLTSKLDRMRCLLPCTVGVTTIVELGSISAFHDVALPLWGGFWFVL